MNMLVGDFFTIIMFIYTRMSIFVWLYTHIYVSVSVYMVPFSFPNSRIYLAKRSRSYCERTDIEYRCGIPNKPYPLCIYMRKSALHARTQDRCSVLFVQALKQMCTLSARDRHAWNVLVFIEYTVTVVYTYIYIYRLYSSLIYGSLWLHSVHYNWMFLYKL